MRTVETKVFKYEELSEAAKNRALESCRDWNVSDDWWYECTIDHWKEKLAEIGFTDARIYFQLSFSQGDGACFDAGLDLEKLAAHLKLSHRLSRTARIMEEIGYDGGIERTSYATHYCHENTRSVSLYFRHSRERMDRAINDLEEAIEELRRDLSQEIYRDLETDYEYLTSDEAVADSLIANEVEFTEDGERYV